MSIFYLILAAALQVGPPSPVAPPSPGAPHPGALPLSPLHHWVLTVSDGDNIPKIVPGKLIAADAGQIVLRKNARENLSFDRSKVVAVLFFPPVDPDLAMKWVDCLGKSEKSDYEDDEGFKNKADFHESMLLNNGDRLYGRFLSARKGIIRFQLVDTNEVISIPLRRVRLWVAGTP